jgi:hypothetical protein
MPAGTRNRNQGPHALVASNGFAGRQVLSHFEMVPQSRQGLVRPILSFGLSPLLE